MIAHLDIFLGSIIVCLCIWSIRWFGSDYKINYFVASYKEIVLYMGIALRRLSYASRKNP